MGIYLMTLFLSLAVLLGSACAEKDQGDDRLKEKARIEEQERADTDNKVLAERAKKMEEDLQRRYRFIKAMSHEYEGTAVSSGSKFKVNIGILPTINIIETERVRTLEEIASDLNSLFLNAQIIMASGKEMAFGCNYIDIRPDIPNGRTDLISEDCPLRLTIYLSDRSNPKREDVHYMSQVLSQGIMDRTVQRIDYLHVKVQSINLPEPYFANLKLTQ